MTVINQTFDFPNELQALVVHSEAMVNELDMRLKSNIAFTIHLVS